MEGMECICIVVCVCRMEQHGGLRIGVGMKSRRILNIVSSAATRRAEDQ